jgi:hypothetical protein
MLGRLDVSQRHLVSAERALDLHTVDDRRARPALRGAQHDHRPAGLLLAALRGTRLDLGDAIQDGIQGDGESLVDRGRVFAVESAGDQERLVSVAPHQLEQLMLGDPGQHRGVRDLVAVEVEDRENHTVEPGVHELVGVPCGRERSRLGFAVADHARDEQVGVVERRTVGVAERVPQFAALMQGARGVGRRVARDAARERELAEQPPDAVFGAVDLRVDLRVRALQIAVGDHARAAVPRAGDVEGVEIPFPDHSVQVGVEEVESGRRPPVTEEPRLDVLGPQRLAQQRIVEQIDLPDAQVVGRPPPRVDTSDLVGGDGTLEPSGPAGGRHHERGSIGRVGMPHHDSRLEHVGGSKVPSGPGRTRRAYRAGPSPLARTCPRI